jgi:GntR family transcriptional regulator, transcriptional repressor for pyruvate dehydrogenase complex
MKLSEAIAAQILDDIARRDLKEGDPLMAEATMLETYGGGRASVREALRILETNGLINIKAGPRGGALVGKVDPVQFGRSASRYFQLGGATVRDLIEARLILEPATTGLAASRRDPVDMERLRSWVEATAATNPTPDDATYLTEAFEFHSLVCGMSGNLILDLITLAMKDVFTSRVRSAVYPAHARKRVRVVHAEIAQLVLDGNAEGAEKLMREHLEEYARYATKRLPGLLDDRVSWQ